jgi:hypothetical protein
MAAQAAGAAGGAGTPLDDNRKKSPDDKKPMVPVPKWAKILATIIIILIFSLLPSWMVCQYFHKQDLLNRGCQPQAWNSWVK